MGTPWLINQNIHNFLCNYIYIYPTLKIVYNIVNMNLLLAKPMTDKILIDAYTSQ